MRHHHSPGIRGQLMWFLCCICLFLLALVWFLSTQLLEPLYTKHIEKQLTTQAESITAELDKAIANGEALSAWSFGHLTVNTAFFDRLATQLYASGSLNSFCVDISDTTMRTIYKIENQSYCNLHETLLSDSANNDMIVSTAVAMRKKCRTTGGFVQTLNPPRLSGSAQLLVGRNTSGGEYTVLVTTSLVHVAEAGRVLSTVLPMAAALIFAFAMTAAWLFSEWFTKPLRQLSSAARQMAMGNYAVQVDTRRSDELGDLARDFNHMASEVQHSSQMQRDLLANVSHDLRTPLTLIKGYAETVRDITGDDKAHRDEQMNIIVDEADRLAIGRIEDLRDILEMTGAPIILIGEEGIFGLLSERRRIWSRVAHEVEFGPISAAEEAMYAMKAAALDIPAELCGSIAERAEGDFRLVRNMMLLLEKAAKAAENFIVDATMLDGVLSARSWRRK